MKVTKLRSIATKGFDLDQELTGRDVFVGPNGTGKTTRLQAMMIATLGYIPSKGKTLSETFEIASGPELSVTAESDTGFTCTRSIKEKVTRNKATGDKSYSLTGSTSIFPPNDEKSETKKKERILKEFGATSDLFDIKEFFDKSEEKRREFIFGLTDPSLFGWDKDRVFKEIEEGHDDKEIIGKLKKIWRADNSVQDNVAIMIMWVKEQLSNAKRALKESAATKKGLLEQKQELGIQVRENHIVKEEMATIRADIEKISGEVASNQEKTRMMSVIRTRISDLKAYIEQPQEARKDTKALSKELSETIKKSDDANNNINGLRNKRAKMSQELAVLSSQKKELITRQEKVGSAEGICPLTNEACTTVESLKEFADSFNAQIKEKSDKMAEIASLIEQTDSIGADASSLSKSLATKVEDLRSEIHKDELAKKEHEARDEKRKELEKANKEIADMSISDVSMLETTLAGLKEREGKLVKEVEQSQEVNDIYKSFDKAKEESLGLEESVEDLEDLMCLLGTGRIQGMMLDDTVSPLIEKINELLSKANQKYNLKLDLYDKNNKPIFQLSWMRGEAEVPFEALSGGEGAIFGVALLYAIILAKNPPLKVICLEASEIDKTNLDMLLANINNLGSEIDNILISTHVTPNDAPDWCIHQLG